MQRTMEGDDGSPDLEIVRPDRNLGCTSSSPSSPPHVDKEDVTSLSIFDLEATIERYRKLDKEFNMKDNNVKIRQRVLELENELVRRRSSAQTGNPVILVEAVQNTQPRQSPARKNHEVYDLEVESSISNQQLFRGSPEEVYPTIALDCDKGDAVSSPVHTKEKEVDEIQDLEKNPPSADVSVCSVCHQCLTTESNKVEECFHCSGCKKSLTASPPNGVTPVISMRNNLSRFTRLTESSAAAKRSQQAIGYTFDTAVELSDDEELKEVAVPESSYSKNLPKRKCLRSASEKLAGTKFLYPSRCDLEAVEVGYADLCHLAPTELLNDTIIDFYMKYMQINLLEEKDRLHRFHFFSCFFYKKLTSSKAQGKERFEKLHKWTKGINIFKKAYLFIPIHDSCHWSLAIVCFPVGERSPLILHLDSMSPTAGHSSQVIYNVLKSYLNAERRYLRQQQDIAEEIRIDPSKAICKRKQVPLQDNEWDCGLFMLYYMQKFVTEVEVKGLDNMFGRDWFQPSEASQLRGTILNILESMFTEKPT